MSLTKLITMRTSQFVAIPILIAFLAYQSANAGPVSFQQAVSDYNSGKYSLALSEFESYAAVYQNNAQVHYYLALCHQALNHVEKARAEYKWVAERQSGALQPLAAAGLARLPGGGGMTQASASSSNGSSTTHNYAAKSSSNTAPASSGPVTCSPELASYMVDLLNKDRAANGVSPPLRQSAKLSQLACDHTLDMVNTHYFGHVDHNGNNSVQRANAAGIAGTVHENISQSYATAGKSMKDLVATCESQMINEPPNQHNHRENILGKFKTIGIGVVITGNAVMLSQEFCDEDI